LAYEAQLQAYNAQQALQQAYIKEKAEYDDALVQYQSLVNANNYAMTLFNMQEAAVTASLLKPQASTYLQPSPPEPNPPNSDDKRPSSNANDEKMGLIYNTLIGFVGLLLI
jgi:hypothetical protein